MEIKRKENVEEKETKENSEEFEDFPSNVSDTSSRRTSIFDELLTELEVVGPTPRPANLRCDLLKGAEAVQKLLEDLQCWTPEPAREVFGNEWPKLNHFMDAFGNLTAVHPKPRINLKSLQWDYSGSTFSFDEEISNALTELILAGESGVFREIPNDLSQFSELRYLDLSGCNLVGTVPENICELTQLEALSNPPVHWDASLNSFTGEIPASIAYLSNLQILNLSCNNISGPIPKGLGALRLLRVLNLEKNNLDGEIPSNLKGLELVEEINMSSNNLSGCIPHELGHLGNLHLLDLSGNKLTGRLPVEFSHLDGL
ncbi:hypothetical protein HDU97_003634 [Phlyctochytrium planicorne]|nr:hypothetical protein HDU97_003634 [Phlyctochytrium planicorne]